LESRAYDRAAIKFRRVEADINFNLNDYEDDLKQVWVVEFLLVNICFPVEFSSSFILLFIFFQMKNLTK